MAEILTHLIEGFDPQKVQENDYDPDWKEIYGAYQNQTVLQGLVTGIETKGERLCAAVSVGHVRGYVPLEASGMTTGRQLHTLTGKTVAFQVLSYDKEGNTFVASRTAALEQIAEITLRKIKEGQIIYAVARTVTPRVVYADIGGIEVSIPKEDMSYGWVDDLTDHLNFGDHIEVKVISVDAPNRDVKVSAKGAQDNPWPDCAGRYIKGNEYVGMVTGVRDFGVFVNLETGVDSLSQHLKFEQVRKGDRVLVRILDVNAKKEQIRTRITRVL